MPEVLFGSQAARHYNALERGPALQVKYFADIRLLAKCSEQQIASAPTTLQSLLTELAAQHGPAFQKRIFDDGKLSKTVVIVVNGQNVRQMAGLETPLGPGDAISIFPVIAGG
jgi:molybdopterin synthase sulfur carrier subunit